MSPQEPDMLGKDPTQPTSEPPITTDPPTASQDAVKSEAPELGSAPAVENTPSEPQSVGSPAVATPAEAQAPATSTVDMSSYTTINPETTPPVQPIVPPAAPKKSPKKLIVIILLALLGLLAIGGGVAFAVWYTSPQKVLNDSLTNFMNTPPKSVDATAAVSVEDTNFKVSVTSFTDGSDNAQMNLKLDVTSSGTAINANIDGIFAQNGDLYFRINDAKKLVTQFTQGSPEAAAMFEGVLKKVDTKWVKITAADIKKLTGEEKSPDSECVSKVITAFQSDAGQKKEVSDLYVKNQFVTVKEQKADEVVDGRNSYHYVLDADEAKAKSFAEGLKQTQVYKKVKDCLGDSFKDDTSSETKQADDTTTSVEVWIDKSTRQMSKLNMTANSAKNKSSAKIDVILGYQTKTISLPKETTSLDEIQQEFQNIFGASAAEDDSVLGASIFNR